MRPLRVKPLPVAEAAEMVRLVPPVLLNVTDCWALDPTVTLPKARLAGLGLNVPGATPVPESAMVSVGLEAVEVRVTFPLTAPAAVGANCTVKVVFCPALSVTGSDRPVRLKPLPVAEAAEMVRLVPPVLLSVTDCWALDPATTVPNERLEGLGLNAAGATPVPESGIVNVGLEAVEVMVTFPLTAPGAVGANCTVKEVLSPALSVRGRLRPLRLKPLPVTEAAEMVTLVAPVLVRVMDCSVLDPTTTFPASTEVESEVSCTGAAAFPETAKLA